MNSDDIFLIAMALRKQPHLAAQARAELQAVHALPEYIQWSNSLEQAHRFQLPREHRYPALSRVGLVKEDVLGVRINRRDDRMFVTDGVWKDPQVRAFPFEDESGILLAHLQDRGWLANCDVAYDLACGCGHTALSLDLPLQVGLDINPRAMAFAGLNRLLNGLAPQRYLLMLNDIATGAPTAPALFARRGLLVVANMPFAPAPAGTLPLTSFGGNDGLDLQRATFRALRQLRRSVHPGVPVRAAVMGMSLGDARRGLWELQQAAVEELPEARLSWELAKSAVLRVDGRRALRNPSGTEHVFDEMANCRLYNPNPQERTQKAKAFRELAAAHIRRGLPDIGLGFVFVEL